MHLTGPGGGMRVTVMGSGGVGAYFGALLARAGHDVTLIARGAHLAAMVRDGLRVESAVEAAFTLPVNARPAPVPGAHADLVLFAVKTYDTAEAATTVAPAVGTATRILTLQNGVDSEEALAARFGAERVVDGVVYVEVALKAPGVVAQRGGPRRVLAGTRDGSRGGAVDTLVSRLREAGWLAEHSPAILRELWAKLTFIGPFAAVSTVTGRTAGELLADEAQVAMLRTAMAEYAAVANAEGAGLPPDAADRAMATLRGFPGDGMPSMLRDRLAGRRLESDALVESVVRRGARHGLPTPATATLARLLAPMAEGASRQG